jgi:isocitrate/isopropylmalate dehydrogenase
MRFVMKPFGSQERQVKNCMISPFALPQSAKTKAIRGQLTCVDKANVFTSMAFFRQIFDEVGANYPDISRAYNYVDAAGA